METWPERRLASSCPDCKVIIWHSENLDIVFETMGSDWPSYKTREDTEICILETASAVRVSDWKPGHKIGGFDNSSIKKWRGRELRTCSSRWRRERSQGGIHRDKSQKSTRHGAWWYTGTQRRVRVNSDFCLRPLNEQQLLTQRRYT